MAGITMLDVSIAELMGVAFTHPREHYSHRFVSVSIAAQ